MNIIKYIGTAFIAIFILSTVSCSKKADIAGIESKLPALKLSSLGYLQNSPFTIATVAATATTPATIATILQLNFGATATNTPVGAFKIEVIDVATPTLIKTVNFASWSGYDATSNLTSTPQVLNHSISYVLQPTTYPNTQVYGVNILLKLGLLGLTAGKTYTVRATAYDSTGSISSVLTQLSFFKTI